MSAILSVSVCMRYRRCVAVRYAKRVCVHITVDLCMPPTLPSFALVIQADTTGPFCKFMAVESCC